MPRRLAPIPRPEPGRPPPRTRLAVRLHGDGRPLADGHLGRRAHGAAGEGRRPAEGTRRARFSRGGGCKERVHGPDATSSRASEAGAPEGDGGRESGHGAGVGANGDHVERYAAAGPSHTQRIWEAGRRGVRSPLVCKTSVAPCQSRAVQPSSFRFPPRAGRRAQSLTIGIGPLGVPQGYPRGVRGFGGRPPLRPCDEMVLFRTG